MSLENFTVGLWGQSLSIFLRQSWSTLPNSYNKSSCTMPALHFKLENLFLLCLLQMFMVLT